MSHEEWEVLIVDSPLREDLYAELWVNGELWAEVFMHENEPIIQFNPIKLNAVWSFNYQNLQEMIGKVDKYVKMMRQTPHYET